MRYLSPPTAKVFPSFILSFFSNEKYTGISLQKVEGEVIVSLSDCKVVPAQNGGKSYCYVDTKYTDDANKDRYCKGYMEMDGVDRFPAHNWSKFGFRLFDDHGEKGEYIYNLASSKYVDELWKVYDPEEKLERNIVDYIRGLHTPRVIEKLSKLVCHHLSEWAYDYEERWLGLKAKIEELYQTYIDMAESSEAKQKVRDERDNRVQEIKEKVEKMSFWKTVISAASAPASPEPSAQPAQEAPSANDGIASPLDHSAHAVAPNGEVTVSATQSAPSVETNAAPSAPAATSAPATASEEKKEDLAPLPKTPYFYFFNPIAFIRQMELLVPNEPISPVDYPNIGDGVKIRSKHPVTGKLAYHKGVDITNYKVSCNGKPIYAPLDGNVIYTIKSNSNSGAGTMIKFKDTYGYVHIFMHLQYDSIEVEVGEVLINQGTVLAKIGSTGGSTGAHLHYEIRDSAGLVVDPLVYNSNLRDIAKLRQGTLDNYYDEWKKYKDSAKGGDLSNEREFKF